MDMAQLSLRTPRYFGWFDLAVVGLLIALTYAVVALAREWTGPLQQVPEIHLEAPYLPLYALFGLSRGVLDEEASSGTHSWLWEHLRRSTLWREGTTVLTRIRPGLRLPVVFAKAPSWLPRSLPSTAAAWVK